jgi:hypothetical protein
VSIVISIYYSYEFFCDFANDARFVCLTARSHQLRSNEPPELTFDPNHGSRSKHTSELGLFLSSTCLYKSATVERQKSIPVA